MMQFLLFLFTMMILSNRQVLSTVDLNIFQQQALDQHNAFRQLHCTVSMVLNSTISAIAQKYAQYLADNKLFQHSGHSGLGENLYGSSSSGAITYINGSTPTNAWYNEISSYNYKSPGFSSATGHFTQVIWKGSIQLGIGIAFNSDSTSAIVVGNYYPPGNYQGEFEDNVLPLCYNNVGGD